MNDKLAKTNINNGDAELIADLVLKGDLAKMNDKQKVQYYNMLCNSLGLNPATRPFQLISFQGKQTLYTTKDATEQLRKLYGVSVVELTQEVKDNLCITKIRVQDKEGRFDMAMGVTSLVKDEVKWIDGKSEKTGKTIPLSSDEIANAMMKSETKAKRRATLSICGLGMLDESELDTITDYKTSDITQTKIEAHNPFKQMKEASSIEEVKKIWSANKTLQHDETFVTLKDERKLELENKAKADADVSELVDEVNNE